MEKKIKSGREIVDDFFNTAKTLPGVDKKIVDTLCDLHKAGKLTNTNIANSLSKLRDENGSSKD